VKVGYEPILNAYAIRQVVKITEILDKKNARNIEIEDDLCLRNGDSGVVKFKFKYRPQFLKVGTRFILCEGKTKIIGEVLEI
jgi:GTPase